MTPVVVSPPLAYVAADWGRENPDAADQWYFPETTVQMLEAFLVSTGIPHEDIARLLSATRPDPANRGLAVTPDPALVRTMDAKVRANVYGQLAKTSLNYNQAHSFRYSGTSVENWLGSPLISASTRQLIEPMVYRIGGCLHFADVKPIRSLVGDEEERRRLAKLLLRQMTLLVRLVIRDGSEVRGLVEYWGRGGRTTDLRPLLDSVAEPGPDRLIDIAHLLPAFARERLYRYPRITTADLDKPVLANCLWTALNFFSATPDDRFLDVAAALDSLRRDYHVVQDNFELGDIIAFMDEQGILFHVAVQIADELAFSKNGTSPMAPFTIQSIDQIRAYYHVRCANPRLIYHRRNGS